jgi:hypothetical protein
MPEPDASAIAAAEAKETVDRIQQIVANARTIWFALLGFLAFIGLTLVSVRDIDFFSLASTTQLPIVNIAIPTTIFFWSAAWLAALIHTYLHLYLLKLWDALADAPATIGGKPLGDRVFPWLVVDWALRQRPDRPTTPRPMDRLADLVSFVVVWTATPAMLTAFWWYSMPAHDVQLTLAIAGALVLSTAATLSAYHGATLRLARRTAPLTDSSMGYRMPAWWGGLVVPVLVLGIFSIGRTAGEVGPLTVHGWTVGPFSARGVSLAPINLGGAQIAQRPANWRDRDVAVRQFRIGWCRDQGLAAQACPPLDQPERLSARTRWCADNGAEEGCDDRFGTLAEVFDRDWAIERRAYLDTIPRPDFNGRDLRGAWARNAFLAGINLAQARLEGAHLPRARLEGADLDHARLEGADLDHAWLEGANLFGARLEGAILRQARLEGADLSFARLEGAILRGARLEGAILRKARLEGADLRRARLQSAEWAGATVHASPAHSANFSDGRSLTQIQLAAVIGDGDTILSRDAETGEQLYVWSCWADPPATLAGLLRRWPDDLHADLRADWLCNERRYPRPEGDQPRRTGRPAPD